MAILRNIFVLVLCTVVAVVADPHGASRQRRLQETLADLVTGSADLSTLLAALTEAELADEFADAAYGPVTVLAPVDAAFAALDQDYLATLLTSEYRAHLVELLLTHVVDGSVLSGSLTNGQQVTAASGEVLTVGVGEETTAVRQGNATSGVAVSFQTGNMDTPANVITPDLEASNGVAHTIDGVLLPEFFGVDLIEFARTSDKTGVSIVRNFFESQAQALLFGVPADFKATIFLPTDAAFDKVDPEILPQVTGGNLLLLLFHHILLEVRPLLSFTEDGEDMETMGNSNITVAISDDGTVTVNNVAISEGDNLASNGVVHIVDTLLWLPGDETETKGEPEEQQGSIANLINTNILGENFTKLTDIYKASGLKDLDAAYTAFAPTNDAFENHVSSDLLENLVKEGWELHAKNLIEYHLHPAVINSADITDKAELTQVNGETITATVDGDRIFFSGAGFSESNVTQPDIPATNGVIHVVDEAFEPVFAKRGLFDLLGEFGGYDKSAELIQFTGISDELPGSFTLFVPSDEAWEKIGEENINLLRGDFQRLTEILLGHVVKETPIPSTSIQSGMQKETPTESIITFTKMGDKIMVDDSKIVLKDILANNGVAHGIDTVIVPPGGLFGEKEESTDDDSGAASHVSVLALALLVVAGMF